MSNDVSIFGHKASVRDVQDRPAYEAPLSRRDFSAALPLLRAAIARGDARAMAAYGALCTTGHGVEKDLQEAYSWFLQGAIHGDVPAQVALGMCLAGGVGAPINRTEAAYWLYRASMAGSLRAIKVLGALVDKDRSVIGTHFTEEELNRLRYTSKKIRVGNLARTSVPWGE